MKLNYVMPGDEGINRKKVVVFDLETRTRTIYVNSNACIADIGISSTAISRRICGMNTAIYAGRYFVFRLVDCDYATFEQFELTRK